VYAGRDYSPAEQVESQIFGFDLVNDLDPGETLTGAIWSLLVIQGTDANPSSHLIGSPTLVTPAGTTLQTATQQRIAGLLPDVLYLVRAVCTTSLSNTRSLWSHIQGEAVDE
jgi:hypothetical protein